MQLPLYIYILIDQYFIKFLSKAIPKLMTSVAFQRGTVQSPVAEVGSS